MLILSKNIILIKIYSSQFIKLILSRDNFKIKRYFEVIKSKNGSIIIMISPKKCIINTERVKKMRPT